MIVNAGYRGKIGAAAPKFTYTGQSNIRKDGVVELLTSGTLVFLEPKVIDVFMVGGGASGKSPIGSNVQGYGGGGGGYTRTIKRVNVTANTQYPVTIGAGGTPTTGTTTTSNANPGGNSGFSTLTVNGGTITQGAASYTGAGLNGGSGGGGGVSSNSDYGTGGSDGNMGERGYPEYVIGGYGQGFTTREFGEAGGKLYAGGGGGGRYMHAQTPVTSMGGSGGGGTGGWSGYSADGKQEAAAGVANTGGGGGGGAYSNSNLYVLGASGGSGIVCFREAQELPELAGTWVFNKRLYQAENRIEQSLNFELSITSSTDFTSIIINDSQVLVRARNQAYSALYTFSSNSWGGAATPVSITLTSTSASDEFRAWLASNATKQ